MQESFCTRLLLLLVPWISYCAEIGASCIRIDTGKDERAGRVAMHIGGNLSGSESLPIPIEARSGMVMSHLDGSPTRNHSDELFHGNPRPALPHIEPCL